MSSGTRSRTTAATEVCALCYVFTSSVPCLFLVVCFVGQAAVCQLCHSVVCLKICAAFNADNVCTTSHASTGALVPHVSAALRSKEAHLCAVIWDALKAACDEPDPNMAATILDSAGVIVSKADLSECYDAKGARALLCFRLVWRTAQCWSWSLQPSAHGVSVAMDKHLGIWQPHNSSTMPQASSTSCQSM